MSINLSHLSFRYGTASDMPELKQLALLSYGQYAPRLPEGGWEKMQTGINNDDMWLGLLKQAKCFLYLHGDTIVGMAFLVPQGNPWDAYPANWCYIRMVGVHPDYEGMGIARTLTQMCIDEARNTGESVIALHTSEVMDAARHIYAKLGFTIVKELPERFGIKYWLYNLQLSS